MKRVQCKIQSRRPRLKQELWSGPHADKSVLCLIVSREGNTRSRASKIGNGSDIPFSCPKANSGCLAQLLDSVAVFLR
ncbi:hypothetical protein COLO4_14821 [Corchorus olitorius]|uniref:Uncharacterized protein n=1 Tax=Corchorus olitorius TaxID=93759 RepID=A0A1R3JQM9_9ROSI|nr:hypothetical protein COLO4_14821 [Corchorus olitorius]